MLRYTDARLIDAACVHLPVGRSEIGPDGLVATEKTRAGIAEVLSTLAAAAA